jgi:teichuronic acid biosynthesis glycosyltransferase TuaC
MKVLHITNNYPTAKYPVFGIFVKEQIESLETHGIGNEVFFINGREKGKSEYLKSVIRLRKLLRNNNYNVIHCHHVLSAICLILSGHSNKFKTIVSFQNDPANEHGPKLFHFIKNHFNAVILKNNSDFVDNKSIFYIPNGVNTSFFQPLNKNDACRKLYLEPSKEYILFVSSNFIRKQKRYDRFCTTLEILKNKYDLKNIEELKLINTKRELAPYFFNAASLHLLTSDFEGSPNSVKEAMACNTPVVSTKVGNVSILLEGLTGSFVSLSDSPDELADLSYVALKKQERGEGRTAIFEKELDMDSVAKQLLSIYKLLDQ